MAQSHPQPPVPPAPPILAQILKDKIAVITGAGRGIGAAAARLFAAHGARVVTETEHNIARVRNRGAAAAQGELLVFLDADTLIPEELLPHIHEVMTATACVGGAVDTDYLPQKRSVRLYLRLWRVLGRVAGMAQGATQFCRRDVFTKLGGYDESLLMGEDVENRRKFIEQNALNVKNLDI